MEALDLGAPVADLASGVTVHHGVEFAVVEGFRPLVLDLYLPTGGVTPGAAIVYLHGGGWAIGSRRRFGRAFAAWSPTPFDLLAQAGFAVATVDYRLSGEA
ncbi:MAG: alpha/beta hydrolase, partial [Ilumatobacteraceae bacterium]